MSQITSAVSFHAEAELGSMRSRWLHLRFRVTRLDQGDCSVDHGVRRIMRFSRKVGVWLSLAFCLAMSSEAARQNAAAPAASKPQTPPTTGEIQARITIEVTGGEKNIPIENASVYVKFIEEHAIKKDTKLEMNVKTSREGVAHVPNAPMGRVLVQVVAEGWKTYGRWMDITDAKQTIKVHLEKPPKWY